MAYSTQPKMWFWIVALFFIFWNLMGVGFWYAEMIVSSEALMEGHTAAQVEFYTSFPSWYTWAYGVAFFLYRFTHKKKTSCFASFAFAHSGHYMSRT
jgi:hypothetical protein